ncbi:MAG: cobalt-precorrin-5B (C(1))-methyltransferase, partial [Nitrososphaera sp.]|nr:cobalt-precorrin-5B (C(1))-methyltransferase [Nitrososphaera sp.]
EDFAKVVFSYPEHCFVQMGDFAGYSVRQCGSKQIRTAVIAGFIGKLTKMAMGVKQTHVAGSHVNMEFMARLAAECGAPSRVVEQIKGANTARHVSEIISKSNVAGYFDLVCKKVHEQMKEYAKGPLEIQVVMFEFDGNVVGKYPK